jgi:hypothetical protein
VACHVIARLFEAPNTYGATFAIHLKSLLVENQLTSKIIYVKDERTNLNTLVSTFTSIISCAPLQLATPFNGTCFDYVMSKACQYAINDIKIGVGMKEVNLPKVRNALQKNHDMDKKIGEG